MDEPSGRLRVQRRFDSRPVPELHSSLGRCFLCGTCAACCPVTAVDPRFNPRRILQNLRARRWGEVDKFPSTWFCADCLLCAERCPQGVRIPELIATLRRRAFVAGAGPAAPRREEESLSKFGRLYELTDFDRRRRARLGLPAIAPTIDEIRFICAVGD